MSNLDYHYALEEIKELAGARLNKIYQSNNFFRFKFNKHGTEYNLLAAPGKRAHLTKYLEEPPARPPHFAAALRRTLENSVLTSIEHINFDRIFALSLKKEKQYRLVFEMFGGGNVVLCDEKEIILQVLERAEYAARRLAPKEKYFPPPVEKKDFRAIKPENLVGLKGRVISALSKAINLSPFYLEEACARAEVKREKEISELGGGEVQKLVDSIAGLADKKQPVLYLRDGKPAAFSPFPLKKLEGQGLEERQSASFNEVLDEYHHALPVPVVESERLRRLRHALQQQEAALKEFREREKAAREKAEAIYAKYDVVEDILAAVKKLKAKEKTEQFEEALKKFRAKPTKTGLAVDI